MRRSWAVASLVFGVSIAGCLDVAPAEGHFACQTSADCPTGWACRGAPLRCYAGDGVDTGPRSDAGPDAMVDAGHDAGVDAARDTGPMHDAFVPHDAPMNDAYRDDTGTDACTVDVLATCTGRCGNVTDARCGVTVDCGNPCVAPQTCGGGGPTFCGCVPDSVGTTCSGRCGPVTNNCGGPVDCGNPCGGSDTCGGGGVPNVCGCTPTGNPCGTNECGPSVDSCGDTIQCDTCSGSRPVCHRECNMCLSSTASCP